MGPRAHRNAARHGVDDLNAEGTGQEKPQTDPRNHHHNPQCPNSWAPLPPGGGGGRPLGSGRQLPPQLTVGQRPLGGGEGGGGGGGGMGGGGGGGSRRGEWGGV